MASFGRVARTRPECPRRDAFRSLPATVAHHWNEAGEPSKERPYAEQAGIEALESGASREAVVYFTRVVELLEGEPPAAEIASSKPRGHAGRFDPNANIDPDSDAFQRGAIETKLCEAYFRLGDLEACRAHGTRALALFGQGHPRSSLGWLAAMLQQIALRSAQSLWPSRRRDVERARRIAPEVVRAHSRLVEASFYQLRLVPIVWSSLRVINHSEPAGPSPDLARGYHAIGVLAALSHIGPLADRWQGRAVQIAEQTGSPYDVAWLLSRISVADLSLCKWDRSDAMIERALQLADDLGDLRLWEECRHVTATGAKYRAQYDRVACGPETSRNAPLAADPRARRVGSHAIRGRARPLRDRATSGRRGSRARSPPSRRPRGLQPSRLPHQRRGNSGSAGRTEGALTLADVAPIARPARRDRVQFPGEAKRCMPIETRA